MLQEALGALPEYSSLDFGMIKGKNVVVHIYCHALCT